MAGQQGMSALARSAARSLAGAGLAALGVVFVHACENPVCGCTPPPPTVAGRWAGSTAGGDSLDVVLRQERGARTFTGAGTVYPGLALSPPRAVTLAGATRADLPAVERFTVYGWRAEPAEFAAGAEWADGRVSGTLRFGPGDETSLSLRRLAR